jgi:hypothetical protein
LAIKVCEEGLGISHRWDSSAGDKNADKNEENSGPSKLRVRVIRIFTTATLRRARFLASTTAEQTRKRKQKQG